MTCECVLLGGKIKLTSSSFARYIGRVIQGDLLLTILHYDCDAQKICHQGDTEMVIPKDDEDVVVRLYPRGSIVKETRRLLSDGMMRLSPRTS